mmetsp:Transcript_64411/g.185062  ORF Transcript_64411/g.185062 Transcript_64411/m.185062 type:complete len:239 (+) Transcript_64411:214-930(+)
MNLVLLPGLQLECKSLQEHDCEDLGLEDRHIHTQADPRAGLKDWEFVGRRCLEGYPALRSEHLGLGIHCRIPSHGIGHEPDHGAFRHPRAVREDVVRGRHLQVDGHGGVQPQRLVDDAVQVGHRPLAERAQRGLAAGRQLGLDLGDEPRLDVRLRRELVEHPREQARCCVSPGDDKVQHHISKILRREALPLLGLDEKRQQIFALVDVGIRATLVDDLLRLDIQKPARPPEPPVLLIQ